MSWSLPLLGPWLLSMLLLFVLSPMWLLRLPLVFWGSIVVAAGVAKRQFLSCLVLIEAVESGLVWLVPVVLLCDVVIVIVTHVVVMAVANFVAVHIVNDVASTNVTGRAVGQMS